MNDITTLRMMIATAALAVVAAVFAGGANAVLLDVEGGSGSGTTAASPTVEPGTIPYLSHGIGVDESQFSGQASPKLTGVHAALARDREPATSSTAERQTIPYLSHGIGVDESQFSGQASLGLTGDSPLTRVSAPEPEGLTGDSALTRVDLTAHATGQATSSGSDTDWTWIGVGAGMAALLAAALTGLYFSARHRSRVALP